MSRKIMVLDCEYMQPSRKCIQIGAAVYDARSAACMETFETYVNPGEPISEYITDLTGIRDQDVQDAPSILEAFSMLKDFHKKHRAFKNPLVWGSGIRNDSQALYEEHVAATLDKWGPEAGVGENFMGWRVLDAKTLFQSIQLFEDGQYAGGLSDSMKRLGLKFEGDKHRALTDAKNTFTIWYYLTRKIHDGLKAKK
jgi:inhibitor of KinA sporulation pathway (predicted exonuclease)